LAVSTQQNVGLILLFHSLKLQHHILDLTLHTNDEESNDKEIVEYNTNSTMVIQNIEVTHDSKLDNCSCSIGMLELLKQNLKQLSFYNCKFNSIYDKASISQEEEMQNCESMFFVTQFSLVLKQHLVNLTSLAIEYSTLFPMDQISVILESVPQLLHLSLNSTGIKAAKDVLLLRQALITYNSNLRELYLPNNQFISSTECMWLFLFSYYNDAVEQHQYKELSRRVLCMHNEYLWRRLANLQVLDLSTSTLPNDTVLIAINIALSLLRVQEESVVRTKNEPTKSKLKYFLLGNSTAMKNLYPILSNMHYLNNNLHNIGTSIDKFPRLAPFLSAEVPICGFNNGIEPLILSASEQSRVELALPLALNSKYFNFELFLTDFKFTRMEANSWELLFNKSQSNTIKLELPQSLQDHLEQFKHLIQTSMFSTGRSKTSNPLLNNTSNCLSLELEKFNINTPSHKARRVKLINPMLLLSSASQEQQQQLEQEQQQLDKYYTTRVGTVIVCVPSTVNGGEMKFYISSPSPVKEEDAQEELESSRYLLSCSSLFNNCYSCVALKHYFDTTTTRTPNCATTYDMVIEEITSGIQAYLTFGIYEFKPTIQSSVVEHVVQEDQQNNNQKLQVKQFSTWIHTFNDCMSEIKSYFVEQLQAATKYYHQQAMNPKNDASSIIATDYIEPILIKLACQDYKSNTINKTLNKHQLLSLNYEGTSNGILLQGRDAFLRQLIEQNSTIYIDSRTNERIDKDKITCANNEAHIQAYRLITNILHINYHSHEILDHRTRYPFELTAKCALTGSDIGSIECVVGLDKSFDQFKLEQSEKNFYRKTDAALVNRNMHKHPWILDTKGFRLVHEELIENIFPNIVVNQQDDYNVKNDHVFYYLCVELKEIPKTVNSIGTSQTIVGSNASGLAVPINYSFKQRQAMPHTQFFTIMKEKLIHKYNKIVDVTIQSW